MIKARGLHIAALMRCKFILARKLREKLEAIRQQEREGMYQRTLFAPEAKVEVSFDNAFEFEGGMYAGQRRYRGPWRPRRHFLGSDDVPAFDGTDHGEEFPCAHALHHMHGLRLGLRTVSSHPTQFFLPTATGTTK